MREEGETCRCASRYWPAALLVAAAPAAATPAEDFQRLLADHYAWLLRENPTEATVLGVRDYDDRIRDISPEAQDRRAREAQAFLARLEAIPPRRSLRPTGSTAPY